LAFKTAFPETASAFVFFVRLSGNGLIHDSHKPRDATQASTPSFDIYTQGLPLRFDQWFTIDKAL
jgi:hypothetical protein